MGLGGTPLLSEHPVAPWPEDILLNGEASPDRLALGITPARCDAHAVAEDKIGTLLPVRLSAGGVEGGLLLRPSRRLAAEIYAFVAEACAARTSQGGGPNE